VSRAVASVAGWRTRAHTHPNLSPLPFVGSDIGRCGLSREVGHDRWSDELDTLVARRGQALLGYA